ncbi:GDP-L-fucose synthase family protein [Oleisolibacter albus]|uniref:GDP-L-fucose synthase family protein n=1 Tax=Oleisolibacter albus TaxID=2171757 RepID=UPI000DF329AB|nr:GDP-L-fucose synthase [Oleisolibacter albus]
MTTKVLVTGATGFLGRHAVPILRAAYGPDAVVGVSSKDYNLLERSQVQAMFDDHKPEVVVHLAAYSGGIGINRAKPADFYYINTILTAHVFEAAAHLGVRKLLYPFGGCSYPADATSPIDEGQLWRGYPQPDSAGYSTAKMMGLVAARSYRTQYGLNATTIIPGNMYGEHDNFRKEESHVVPAMVRRYYEAMLENKPFVEMWGTGKALRDFVYAGDVARTLPFFIDSFDESGPVNVSSGTSTSIRELAETIAKLVGFQGEIRWDATKPEGQLVKLFSADKLHGLGLSCATSLEDGLRSTIQWFNAHYATAGDGLRL